jgi:DNA (cytosine-5)-methyltransferase 1
MPTRSSWSWADSPDQEMHNLDAGDSSEASMFTQTSLPSVSPLVQDESDTPEVEMIDLTQKEVISKRCKRKAFSRDGKCPKSLSFVSVDENGDCLIQYGARQPATMPVPSSKQPSPSEEPEFSVVDAIIKRNFTVGESLNPGADDYLDDKAFEEWLRTHQHIFSEEVPNEDELRAEDIVSEETIVDHLRSLVISPPGTPHPEPERLKSQRSVFAPQKWEMPSVRVGSVELKRGITVELSNGSFLHISSIWCAGFDVVIIKGYGMSRDAFCGTRLPDGRINELVWVNEVEEDLYRAGLESVLQEKDVSSVKCIREVVFTNAPYAELSFEHELAEQGLTKATVDLKTVRERGKLYCRWKFVQVQSRLKTSSEACIRLLTFDEAQDCGKFDEFGLRENWRGGKHPVARGSWKKEVIVAETGETMRFIPPRTSSRRYTIGDCFCGAGGISRGAVEAGLALRWAFDQDPDHIQVHQENFQGYGTQSYKMSDEEFIRRSRDERYYVDIVHFSPPCCAFSSANMHTNLVKDEVNQNALFSLYHLTQRLKPRIATVEETVGLMHRHKEWFDALICIFLTVGYSVRWKLIRCQDYGIPQSRIRLLLLAAA